MNTQDELTASSSTLADSVENSILEYIRNKKLKPGDSLPKEEEFAAGLNVSRNIIREGLSGLKTLGLIESRKRRGMVLRHPNIFEGVRKLVSANLFTPEECREFMQIRVIMELGMIHQIWKNKTPEKCQELRFFTEKPGVPPLIEEEIQFHCKLFAMGGNLVANQFQNILVSSFSAIKPLTVDEWENIPSPRHSEICDVLESGTKEEFFNIMEQHLSAYF